MGLKREVRATQGQRMRFAPYMGLKRDNYVINADSSGFAPYMGLKSIFK